MPFLIISVQQVNTHIRKTTIVALEKCQPISCQLQHQPSSHLWHRFFLFILDLYDACEYLCVCVNFCGSYCPLSSWAVFFFGFEFSLFSSSTHMKLLFQWSWMKVSCLCVCVFGVYIWVNDCRPIAWKRIIVCVCGWLCVLKCAHSHSRMNVWLNWPQNETRNLRGLFRWCLQSGTG